MKPEQQGEPEHGEPEHDVTKCRPDVGLEEDPIVTELRKLYTGIAEEPVPDHLLNLLQRLDEVERKR